MKTAHAIYECRLCKATFAVPCSEVKPADHLIRRHYCREEVKGIGIADNLGVIETDQPMGTPAEVMKALDAVRHGH